MRKQAPVNPQERDRFDARLLPACISRNGNRCALDSRNSEQPRSSMVLNTNKLAESTALLGQLLNLTVKAATKKTS